MPSPPSLRGAHHEMSQRSQNIRRHSNAINKNEQEINTWSWGGRNNPQDLSCCRSSPAEGRQPFLLLLRGRLIPPSCCSAGFLRPLRSTLGCLHEV